VRPKYGLWQPEYWRRRLPISFLSFKAANGTWIAEWYLRPSLTQKNDFIFFDVVFNRNIARNVEKRLQLQIHTAALRKNPKRWPRLERRPIVLGNLMHVRPVERVGVRYRPADPPQHRHSPAASLAFAGSRHRGCPPLPGRSRRFWSCWGKGRCFRHDTRWREGRSFSLYRPFGCRPLLCSFLHCLLSGSACLPS
jgi:hypothetical protein